MQFARVRNRDTAEPLGEEGIELLIHNGERFSACALKIGPFLKGPSWSIFPLFATRLFRNYPLVSPLVFAENPEKPSFPQLRLRPKLGRFEIPLFGGFASDPAPLVRVRIRAGHSPDRPRHSTVTVWASTVHLSVRPYFLGVCVPLPGFQCMLDPGLRGFARAADQKWKFFADF